MKSDAASQMIVHTDLDGTFIDSVREGPAYKGDVRDDCGRGLCHNRPFPGGHASCKGERVRRTILAGRL